MKFAIIGSGISGLGAAYLLNAQHEVTVYEQNDTPGGHSRTVEVKTGDGIVPVDTGFIVFNKRNYPHLTGLFDHLNVPIAKSDMSFGVSIDQGWLEYSTQNLGHLFAQKRNVMRPAFWQMIADILRFNKQAKHYIEGDANLTLGECLDQLALGGWFQNYYLLAMGGAIWSTPLAHMLDFPAQTFLRFFDNHGLLTVSDQPQWYTVVGGSREYIKRISANFQDRIKIGTSVQRVIRKPDHIEVVDHNNDTNRFDQIVFACHPDQALKMLDQPSDEERSTLGQIRYQPNDMVLHSDTSFMPKRKKAWASWVYLSETRNDETPAVSLSYWMNNLQPLETNTPIIVTLNPSYEPDPNQVYDHHQFHHPVFDKAAIKAQSNIPALQGQNRTWYCGAWQRYGFHEDGLLSAVNVAKGLGAKVPWS